MRRSSAIANKGTFTKAAEDAETRLLLRCVIDTTTGCWNCLGSKYGWGGYPGVWNGRKQQRASRFVWMSHNGPLPPKLCVCHKCDNRLCVNLDHLFVGTFQDNAMDAYKKGRMSVPSFAKLTEDQVRAIRSLIDTGMRTCDVAKKYGIDWTTAYNIGRRNSWAYLDNPEPKPKGDADGR